MRCQGTKCSTAAITTNTATMSLLAWHAKTSNLCAFLVLASFTMVFQASRTIAMSIPSPPTKDSATQRDARRQDRRAFLQTTGAALAATTTMIPTASKASTAEDASPLLSGVRDYRLQFPTLFDPLYGTATRETKKYPIGDNIWSLEQNLELGPLQTPLRCVVVRLSDDTLWVHAPLAPTEEFFDLVESCSSNPLSAIVSHIVVPTYALEHKVFVKDALRRWPNAQLWTSPGQFSFPFRNVPDQFVFGKPVTGVLSQQDLTTMPPWIDEIQYETLEGGTFQIGGVPTTLCETAFFHKRSKSLIVTDALAQIPESVPPLNDPEKLLLISKRSTSDPQPEDTPEARLSGWEKTALLVSYFFPEHEELDPDAGLGVVTWTEGWEDNFRALAGRLLVPPVVRTLIYAQDTSSVRDWVDRVMQRQWEFEQIVPAHFEAPIRASPKDFAKAFAFLEDSRIDPFPENDLARGLKPIADIASQIK